MCQVSLRAKRGNLMRKNVFILTRLPRRCAPRNDSKIKHSTIPCVVASKTQQSHPGAIAGKARQSLTEKRRPASRNFRNVKCGDATPCTCLLIFDCDTLAANTTVREGYEYH